MRFYVGCKKIKVERSSVKIKFPNKRVVPSSVRRIEADELISI